MRHESMLPLLVGIRCKAAVHRYCREQATKDPEAREYWLLGARSALEDRNEMVQRLRERHLLLQRLRKGGPL